MSSSEDGDPTRDLVIVSGADSGYFALLQDAVRSVRALRPEVAIGVFDLGLARDDGEPLWLGNTTGGRTQSVCARSNANLSAHGDL